MKKIIFIILCCMHVCANDLTWGGPEVLSTLGINASDARVGMDASGNIVAAWIEAGVVMSKIQTFGGSWSSPAIAVSDMGASSLELVVDPAGNATAIWNLSGVIESASLPFSGTWGMPITLSSSGSSSPQIAVDSSGNLAAIWVNNDVIQAATQAFGMSWSSSTDLSFLSSPSDSPQIAINNNQTIVAVWHSTESGIDAIFATSTTLGTSWPGGTSLISDPNFSSVNPHVAIDSQDRPIVVWYRFAQSGTDYSNVFAQAVFGNADTSWNLPMDLTSPAGIRDPNDLIISVAFNQFDVPFTIFTMGFDSSAFVLHGSIFLGGSWIDIPYTGLDIDLLDQNFMISSSNYVYAAFMSHDPDSMLPVIRSFKKNTDNSQQNFGNILTVSTSGSNAFPRIAGTLVGMAHSVATVWLNFEGTSNVVQASVAVGVAVPAPISVAVTQGSNDFGVYTEYFNTLSWSSASPPDSSSQWIISRDGVIIQVLPAGTLTFVDHNAVQNQPETYGVALQTNDGDLSPISTVSFP